jgi:hypothetical protein
VAGHRHTRKPGTSTIRQRHHVNARALVDQRLDVENNPVARLAHAYAYVRSAARRAGRRSPERDLSLELDAAVRALLAAGDRLIK